MESEIMRNGLPRLRVRIVRTYKQGRVKINNKNQLLEKRGQEITCSCSNLKPNKVYLIIGKEDKRKRVLYLDNFSTALEWNKNGKSYVRSYKKKISCPEKRTTPQKRETSESSQGTLSTCLQTINRLKGRYLGTLTMGGENICFNSCQNELIQQLSEATVRLKVL